MTPANPRIEHGTNASYEAHRRHSIPMCDACREAHRQYGRDYEKKRTQKRAELRSRVPVPVPLVLFAEMYWTASQSTVARLDKEFGRKRIDDLIARADTMNEMG